MPKWISTGMPRRSQHFPDGIEGAVVRQAPIAGARSLSRAARVLHRALQFCGGIGAGDFVMGEADETVGMQRDDAGEFVVVAPGDEADPVDPVSSSSATQRSACSSLERGSFSGSGKSKASRHCSW